MLKLSALITTTIIALGFSTVSHSFFIPSPPAAKTPYAYALVVDKRPGLPDVKPINARMNAQQIGSCMYMLGEAKKLQSGFSNAHQFYSNAYLLSGGHNFPPDANKKIAEMAKHDPKTVLNNAKQCLWLLEPGFIRLAQMPAVKAQLQCTQGRISGNGEHAARLTLDTLMVLRTLGLNYAYAQDIMLSNITKARADWQKLSVEKQQTLTKELLKCDSNTSLVTAVTTLAYNFANNEPMNFGTPKNLARTQAIEAIIDLPQQRQNLICNFSAHQWNFLNLISSSEFKAISAELNKTHQQAKLHYAQPWFSNLSKSLLPETKALFAEVCN